MPASLLLVSFQTGLLFVENAVCSSWSHYFLYHPFTTSCMGRSAGNCFVWTEGTGGLWLPFLLLLLRVLSKKSLSQNWRSSTNFLQVLLVPAGLSIPTGKHACSLPPHTPSFNSRLLCFLLPSPHITCITAGAHAYGLWLPPSSTLHACSHRFHCYLFALKTSTMLGRLFFFMLQIQI